MRYNGETRQSCGLEGVSRSEDYRSIQSRTWGSSNLFILDIVGACDREIRRRVQCWGRKLKHRNHPFCLGSEHCRTQDLCPKFCPVMAVCSSLIYHLCILLRDTNEANHTFDGIEENFVRGRSKLSHRRNKRNHRPNKTIVNYKLLLFWVCD